MKKTRATTELLLVGVMLAGACASATPVDTVSRAQVVADSAFTELECGFSVDEADSDAEVRARGAMLRLARPAHSVMLRRVRTVEGGASADTRYRIQTLARIGEECTDRSSQSRCRDLLASVELGALESLFAPSTLAATLTYFVVGTGESFQVVTSDSDLQALLGPVDTAAEAWFWLMRSTDIGTFACGAADQSAHRSTANGFELRVRLSVSDCRPLTEADITYRVAPDGAVVELHREIVRNEPNGCVVP